MIALGLAIGVVAGSILQRVVLRFLFWLAVKERPVNLLEVSAADEGRTTTLEQLIEAVRAAALRVELTADGFNVLSQPPSRFDHIVGVRVLDPTRVGMTTLQLTYSGSYPLAFHVVLALVPVLGPLAIMINEERVVVDGCKNVHELTNAHARYVRARIRERVAAARSETRS
ncbi:MAG TPA: hypothetical protein VN253_15375 [Kofleriaceae bacterium]|nr:hypothetical protein [Kofleriaceae bacterium]